MTPGNPNQVGGKPYSGSMSKHFKNVPLLSYFYMARDTNMLQGGGKSKSLDFNSQDGVSGSSSPFQGFGGASG